MFNTIYSQNSKKIDSIIKLYQEDSIRINRINNYLNTQAVKKNDSLHFYYQDYAYWLYDINKKNKAILYEEKALNFAKSRQVFDSVFIHKSLFYLGFYYQRNNNILKSNQVLKEALTYRIKSIYNYKIYKTIGKNYWKIHNYHKALNYYETAYSQIKNVKTKSKDILILANNIINDCQRIRTKKAIEKGIIYSKIADSISHSIPISDNLLYVLNMNIGSLYNTYKNLNIPLALKYYNKALNVAKKQKDRKKIAKVYLWIGNLYNSSDSEQAISNLNKSLLYISKSDSLYLYKINYNLSLAYATDKKYKKSIYFGHKSLSYLLHNDLKNLSSINYQQILTSKNIKLLRYIIPNLASAYLKYYEESNKSDLLRKSISYYKLSDYIIDLLKINSQEFKSKLFWQRISTNIYGKAIRACCFNDNTEDAFYFMEKNKALLLMEEIASQNFRQTLEVAPKYLEKEKELKQKLFYLKNELTQNEKLTTNQKDSLKKEQLDGKRELLIFQDSIYKNKSSLKEPTIYSLKELQKKLKENEVVIEYHISIDDEGDPFTNNQNGYALFITKDNTRLFEISNQPQLKKQITQFAQLIAKPFTTTESRDQFTELSNQVFTTLFPTQEIRELIKGKKLTIIADNYLLSLPFEVLITNKKTAEYLIESNEISYEYSFSFSEQNKKLKRNPAQGFIGFAPVNFNNDTLSTLYHSEKEITEINKITDGELFIKEKATKAHFLEKMNQAKIIHLATHAESNDRVSPWIAFKDSILYLEELSLTRNQSDLTVLSACNTSTGELVTGEGVLSLARGFFLSGTKSVVSSLWSTDDKATGSITKNFYTYLKKGETKSSALRKAKLKYLKNHSASLQSPFYWSPLILIGDANPIAFKPDYTWVVYSISLLFFFALSFLVFLAVRKSKNNKDR